MPAPPDPKTQTTSALLRRSAGELDSLVSGLGAETYQLELVALAVELRVRATRIEAETEISTQIYKRMPNAVTAARLDSLKFIDKHATTKETNGNRSDD